MLDNARSHGLWELTAPPAPETSGLKGSIRVDTAIVGGGYTGLSAALHLAEAGANVALLEAVEIGFGGAGRNVGLVNAGMWVMPDVLGDVLGGDYGERLLELLGDAPKLVFDLIERHRIECEVERAGTLHCAVGLKGLRELEQRAAQWSRRGAPVELLNAADTAAKIGSSAYAGSLWDRRAGTIQPLAYARGLARNAVNVGAKIFTRSAVTSAERVDGKWKLHAAGGHVIADRVIVATDAYATGPWSEVRTEQIHLPYFNFATQPLSDNVRASILPERQGAWDTNEVLSSFRFDRAGRLVFGSCGALRGTGAAVHRSWARRALKKLFPQIGDVRFEAEWYGLIGMTDDHLPRFHKLAENVFGFSGYNGRGIAPGTTFGRLLALYALGQLDEKDLPLPASTPIKPNFRSARTALYEVGAQFVHLIEARL
ncbi:NAD(P)/FAD-dependent oxidoreductase [Bradyrhizobium sp. CCBAU 11361]|uniref:NAD(P)/FAD-dependent oxidoreductase n=1 Tax=Bradyrhizobium sp. CCBAU 11361 TaxID=1630812 RepID=UPI0023038851|nr:FAD-binding oxidoreductase [Bradyrhizobium sp. CCBAU 11361]MDA9487686.1 FAD-dependent oxidoreductase [Bradyrhizobium sp. CCBAU 11361]